MITVVEQSKVIHKRMKSLQPYKKKEYIEQSIEELLFSKNIEEIESSHNKKDLLELKRKIIIYRIKKLRNESALKIQKMWNIYQIRLKAHKIAHHVQGCYTISPDLKNACKIYIKIFTNELIKEEYQIQRLKYCPIRNAFVIDIPKNKFYTSKKIMHFNFIKNNQIFFDDKYDKVLYLNEYVHQIDFSLYDKRQKKLNETIYSVNELFPKYKHYNSNSKDSNYLSTEDEKENSESFILTPDKFGKNDPQFKFSAKEVNIFNANKDNDDDDEEEYAGLRSIKRKRTVQSTKVKINRRFKRFESFDSTYSCKSKLKSILKGSNCEELHKRRLNMDSGKKVSFGKTVYFY